jgi:hypothetical protein
MTPRPAPRKKQSRRSDDRQGDLFAGNLHIHVTADVAQPPPAWPPPAPVVDLDQPLRLSVAATTAFPDGSMSKSGLRREAARGRLVIQRIAGKDYTTLRAIGEMRELCRVEARGRACGSRQPGDQPMEKLPTIPSGASAMDETSAAQALALAKLETLSLPSPTTSSPNPPRRASATVIRLSSRSQT